MSNIASATAAWKQHVKCMWCAKPLELTTQTVTYEEVSDQILLKPEKHFIATCAFCTKVNIVTKIPSTVAVYIQSLA